MSNPKINVGDVLAPRSLASLAGDRVPIPHGEHLVHLHFRRFAACPICQLHLRSLALRHDELVAAGVREVAVFHSSAESMRPYYGELPFSVVPDPERQLYGAFGVGASVRALLHPRAWRAAMRGRATIERPQGAEMRAEGGVFGLPADFLIAPDGRVLACKYGAHADDQWSVDELLDLARESH